MTAWLNALARDRTPELAVALALGYAVATLAGAMSDVAIDVVGEVFGRNPFDPREGAADFLDGRLLLNFQVGSVIVGYGHLLSALLASALVLLFAMVVERRRDRAFFDCPECAAPVPRPSTTCAFCGSTVEPTPS